MRRRVVSVRQAGCNVLAPRADPPTHPTVSGRGKGVGGGDAGLPSALTLPLAPSSRPPGLPSPASSHRQMPITSQPSSARTLGSQSSTSPAEAPQHWAIQRALGTTPAAGAGVRGWGGERGVGVGI